MTDDFFPDIFPAILDDGSEHIIPDTQKVQRIIFTEVEQAEIDQIKAILTDAKAQQQAAGIVVRQLRIKEIIAQNHLDSAADWTGYDG